MVIQGQSTELHWERHGKGFCSSSNDSKGCSDANVRNCGLCYGSTDACALELLSAATTAKGATIDLMRNPFPKSGELKPWRRPILDRIYEHCKLQPTLCDKERDVYE